MFQAQLVSDFIEKKLTSIFAFTKSRIPQRDAHEHIRYYRGVPSPSSLWSVWLDAEIIDFIAKHGPDLGVNGVRIYFAKYKEGFYPVTEKPELKDNVTVIVVPTLPGVEGDEDIPTAYFNYGRPCPPSCNGGI